MAPHHPCTLYTKFASCSNNAFDGISLCLCGDPGSRSARRRSVPLVASNPGRPSLCVITSLTFLRSSGEQVCASPQRELARPPLRLGPERAFWPEPCPGLVLSPRPNTGDASVDRPAEGAAAQRLCHHVIIHSLWLVSNCGEMRRGQETFRSPSGLHPLRLAPVGDSGTNRSSLGGLPGGGVHFTDSRNGSCSLFSLISVDPVDFYFIQ